MAAGEICAFEARGLAPTLEKRTTDLPAKPGEPFQLDLPVPQSVNRLRKVDWRAGRGMSGWVKKADALMLAARCRSRNPILFRAAERFELHIIISEKHTRIDLDNGLKHIIDYLKRIEAIKDDSPKHLRKLTVEWGLAPEGCRVIVVPL